MGAVGKTPHGFDDFGGVDADDRGQTIRVTESSEVGRPRCCVRTTGGPWDPPFIHLGSPLWPHPYLNVAQAKQLRDALDRFITAAESPTNWRNKPEYREVWG